MKRDRIEVGRDRMRAGKEDKERGERERERGLVGGGEYVPHSLNKMSKGINVFINHYTKHLCIHV